MTAPKGRKHKRCIFCNGTNVSKEHFYSQWMADLVDGGSGHVVESITSHKVHGLLGRKRGERPAPMHTKTVRAPCRTCNSGWMNRIEEAARPHLTSMIIGEPTALNLVAQLAVARWIALKVMVVEHADDQIAVTPPEDRSAFMERGQIPPYFRIYVAQHSANLDVYHQRHSTTVSLNFEGPVPPMNGMKRNVQQVTFLAGRLAVHVNAARVDDFFIEERVPVPFVHDAMRLWPMQRVVFQWPEGLILGHDAVGMLATTLETLVDSDRAVHGGELPE